jgi:hypothetical protein
LLKTYEYLRAHPIDSGTLNTEGLLELANYFIEERGTIGEEGHYFEVEARARGEEPDAGPAPRGEPTFSYYQADGRIRDLKEVNGHSVRAMYVSLIVLGCLSSFCVKVLAHRRRKLGAAEAGRKSARSSRTVMEVND